MSDIDYVLIGQAVLNIIVGWKLVALQRRHEALGGAVYKLVRALGIQVEVVQEPRP